MLEISWLAAQLAASEEGLSSVCKSVSMSRYIPAYRKTKELRSDFSAWLEYKYASQIDIYLRNTAYINLTYIWNVYIKDVLPLKESAYVTPLSRQPHGRQVLRMIVFPTCARISKVYRKKSFYLSNDEVFENHAGSTTHNTREHNSPTQTHMRVERTYILKT
jgi:hypothetical protein